MANTSYRESTDAFEEATRRLNDDTASFLAQIKVLERQRAIMNASSQALPSTPQDNVQQTIRRQRAQLSLQAQQTSSTLHEKLGVSLQSIETMVESLPDIIGRALIKDDRMLDNLQRIVSRLDVNDDLEGLMQRSEILCKNFALLESQAVVIRLDDTYQKALTTYHTSPRQGSVADVDGLRAELEDLHGEVDGLVQLIAEHHYKTYIQQAAERSHLAAADEASRWSEYTAGTLLYLIARLEALGELIKHTHLHKSAILELQNELTATTREKTRPEIRHQHSGSMSGLKPLRLVQSSLSQGQDQLAPLLKLLDINPKQASSAALSDLLASRRGASRNIQANSHTAVMEEVITSLGQGSGHVDVLLHTLDSYFEGKDRSILEHDQAANLEELESRIESTARLMQDLDIDKITADLSKS